MQCTRTLCHIHKKKKTCKLQGKQMKTLCHHLGQCSPPIKLISIYALSELSAHVEHTQLAGGSAENAQPGQVGNGKWKMFAADTEVRKATLLWRRVLHN